MPNDTPKDKSDMIASQEKMVTDMGARLGPEWAAAREQHQHVELGRNVGAPPTIPVLVEGRYTMPADPHNGAPPAQPPEKQ